MNQINTLEPLESRLFLTAAPHFKRVNFQSDGSAVAAQHHDPNLVNGWGLAAGSDTEWWVADNGTGKSTLYNGSGAVDSLVVTVPPPTGQSGGSAPTGEVFNGTNSFDVGPNWPAQFIFSTEDGTISGWSPLADPTHAILKVDHSAQGAVYKGLAIGTSGGNDFIYATDFHNNRVDVFNSSFQPATLAGSFHDGKIPAGYAPFGIQNLNGKIYVTYANQDTDAHDDIAGRGHGFVDIFNTDGTLVQRIAHRGFLNSPWGLAIAPASWGKFKHDLLVGNFGDGFVQVLDPSTGAFISYLRNSAGTRIHTSGLWAIMPGNNGLAGASTDLFFTAGPNSESHGLFGKFAVVHKTPAAPPPTAPAPPAPMGSNNTGSSGMDAGDPIGGLFNPPGDPWM